MIRPVRLPAWQAASLPIRQSRMQELQRWLLAVTRSALIWLTIQWQAVVHGIMHEWPVVYFILGMGLLLVVGLTSIWRRGSAR